MQIGITNGMHDAMTTAAVHIARFLTNNDGKERRIIWRIGENKPRIICRTIEDDMDGAIFEYMLIRPRRYVQYIYCGKRYGETVVMDRVYVGVN